MEMLISNNKSVTYFYVISIFLTWFWGILLDFFVKKMIRIFGAKNKTYNGAQLLKTFLINRI